MGLFAKRLLFIVLGVIIGLTIGSFLASILIGCGSTSATLAPQPTVTVTAIPVVEEPLYTDAEQEIYDYVATHLDEMEAIVVDTSTTLDAAEYDSTGASVGKISKLIKRYGKLNAGWVSTNGGDFAGGVVNRLEELWERTGSNLMVVLKQMAMCYIKPSAVNITRAAKALIKAEDTVKDVRTEFESLKTGY